MNGEGMAIGRPPQANALRQRAIAASPSTNLADLLERVLDKGIVIAGDITLCLGAAEVLTLKIRLLIASLDKAEEVGINWWRSDPFLSSRTQALEQERDQMKARVESLEATLAALAEHRQAEQPESGEAA